MSKQAMEMARKTLQDLYASFVDSVEGGPADELMQDTMTAIEALKEAIKQQDTLGEPVAMVSDTGRLVVLGARSLPVGTPLYTSAPSIPEGWQLVPIIPTEEMKKASREAFLYGDHEWGYMIDAAPSYKGEQP